MSMENVGKGCLIGCFGMIVAIVMVFLGFAALLWLGFSALDDEVADMFGTDRPECERSREKIWVSGNGGEDNPQVLRVKIDGVIADVQEDIFGREKASAMSALGKIRAATRDEKIRGLYLVLDTPGGEVTLSDIIADAVQRFRNAKEGRFVLVEMGSLCCSGGYYIAAGADYIIAHPTTVTGSIGVIMSTLNAAELAKKIGVESVIIATGANKAMLDPLKPVAPEHVEIFRKAIDADYERFLDVVAKGRNIPKERIRPIADGRILCAAEAKSQGLIDEIGYSEEAEAQLLKMAKAESIRIIRYKDKNTFSDLFGDSFFSSQGMGKALKSASSGGRSIELNFMAK